MIAIIDYGMGNLRSVFNAFHAIGEAARIVHQPAELRDAEAVVLPGVGAFGDGMEHLRARGFVEALEDIVLGEGKPFLGICLGMQLLATTGLEHGRHDGLGWIAGVVDRIPVAAGDSTTRIPHVGWDDVSVLRREGLYVGVGDSPVFYFTHSYVFHPGDPAVISGRCAYGATAVTASVEHGQIWGVQFHPEKSQRVGLAVLKNFAALRASSPCSRNA